MDSENIKEFERRFSLIKDRLERAGLYRFFDRLQGGSFYLVGGAVRDLILNREIQDVDLVVQGIPLTELGDKLQNFGKVQFVGKTFGVYKWIPDVSGTFRVVDIALPRTERSLENRGAYRDFEVFSRPDLPLEEDLKRRDFTVNAMALDLRTGELVDPFAGVKDIKEKKLRAVGRPHERFQEDYSRMLRGIRFACQLGFDFEPETWRALKELGNGLMAKREDGGFIVPREVIGKELVRAFTCDPVRAFDLLDESQISDKILPELLPMKGCPQPKNFHSEGDVWTHTRLALRQLSSPVFQKEFPGERPDAELILSVLFHDIGKPHTLKTPERDGTDRIRFDGHDRVGARMASQICARLKLSQYPKGDPLHADAEDIAWLVGKHLILVQGQVHDMKATTIERYFLNPGSPGRTLLKLILADALATIHENGSPDLTSYHQVKERIREIQARADQARKVPPPLLNGREVMTIVGVPAGPKVGELLGFLREEQLTGRIKDREEAIEYLEKYKSTLDREAKENSSST